MIRVIIIERAVVNYLFSQLKNSSNEIELDPDERTELKDTFKSIKDSLLFYRDYINMTITLGEAKCLLSYSPKGSPAYTLLKANLIKD